MLFCRFCQVVVMLISLIVSRNSASSFRILLKRQESGVCPDNYFSRSGLCYFLIARSQEYEAGKQACQLNYKESLPATFRSKEDFDFVSAQVLADDGSWIGLRKKEGTFMIWEDGSSLTYENFTSLSEASSNPDRNCVVVRTNGLWEARPCRHFYYIYCSLPAAEDSCAKINCHARAICYNTFLSGVCVCNDGYAGDGISSCIRSPGCPDDEWKEHKGICYRQVSTRATYEKARLICKSDFNGSDLAKIRYKGDNDFLTSSFEVDGRHWIGLRRRTNRWTDELTWEDNSTVIYKAFDPSEPTGGSQDLCIYVRSGLRWFDSDCGINEQSFCSLDATKWGGVSTEPGTGAGSGIGTQPGSGAGSGAGAGAGTKAGSGAGTIAGIIVGLLLLAIGGFVGYKRYSHRKRNKSNDGSTYEDVSGEQ